MARLFNGGTDRLQWTVPTVPPNIGCISLWFRTTQTTTNSYLLTHWNSSSRNGWGLINNNTANKTTFIGYSSAAQRILLTSTTTINDGVWHHVAANYNRNSGGANALYVDGVNEASGNSSGAWTTAATNYWIAAGVGEEGFWPTMVGEVAAIGHWDANLSADEIAALAKGFSPKIIRPESLIFHAPCVRETHELVAGLTGNATGGDVAPHCRVVGGSI